MTIIDWLPLLISAISLIILIMFLKKLLSFDSNDLEKSIREEFRISHEEAAKATREEFKSSREEAAHAARELREEVATAQKTANETVIQTIGEMRKSQKDSLESIELRIKDLVDSNRDRLDKLRNVLDSQIKSLQQSNEKKLDQMRETVDEKLQTTLEKRLGESFKLVSERLESVQKGLGEMQTLATGVGDLKRVLTNVKARGTWGEVQLGAILEQILTPDQYAKNVKTREGSQDHVEYAIRLPGPEDNGDAAVWLPIDSKFPQEDYLRLVGAADTADSDAMDKALAALARSIQNSAKEISAKYLDPPQTTDFAIMFLPTEGLYAEVLRQPGLIEKLQQDFRVVVTGPTTLSATLSSLRMGFRTLAIEKRSSEVWKILAAVKSEFGKFGGILDRVKKQLDTASNTIDQTGVRSRAMERKLKEVEQLPVGEAEKILGLTEVEPGESAED
ncbi:MAG: DNA recombination protein RmuC [Thermodesulfobacteriota bacterium]